MPPIAAGKLGQRFDKFVSFHKKRRHLTVIDVVGCDNDSALARLPENLGQAHDGDNMGRDQVGHHGAGAT